jgi:mRNA interferase YafQ
MRTIKRAASFKKDFKKALANPRHADLAQVLVPVLLLLAEDKPLPAHYRDHALVGNWKNYRECHLKPDLLLIYKAEEPNLLKLARLGSHSELFKK